MNRERVVEQLGARERGIRPGHQASRSSKVCKKALLRLRVQPPRAFAWLLTSEPKLGRIVKHEDIDLLGRTPYRCSDMRGKQCLRRHFVVREEAIRCLKGCAGSRYAAAGWYMEVVPQPRRSAAVYAPGGDRPSQRLRSPPTLRAQVVWTWACATSG
jgi:hypothetical protein